MRLWLPVALATLAIVASFNNGVRHNARHNAHSKKARPSRAPALEDEDVDEEVLSEKHSNRFAVAEAEEAATMTNEESMELSMDAEAEVEPVTMGVLAAAKAVAVTAQLIFAIGTAREAASIEMAGKDTELLAEELDEQLRQLENLLSSATSEANTRLGDAIQELAENLIDTVANNKPDALKPFMKQVGSTATKPAEMVDALKLQLQAEYDAKLALGGKRSDAVNVQYILTSAMPLMDALQDILIPVTQDKMQKQLDAAVDKAEASAKSGGKLPNLADRAFELQRSALLSAKTALIQQRKQTKSASSVTKSGSAPNQPGLERVRALLEEQSAALSGEFSDFADAMYSDGFGVAVGAEKAKGLTRLFNGFQELEGGDAAFEAQMTPLSEALSVLSAAQSLWSVYNGFKVMRTAEYETWRRSGIARESSQNVLQEAEYNVCRLLMSLYMQLRRFSELSVDDITKLPWEKLMDGPLYTSLGVDKTPDVQMRLRKAVHATLCGVFYPLRKRLGAYFRNGGQCVNLRQYGTPKVSFRSSSGFDQSSLEVTGEFATIVNCDPSDIYDLRLVTSKVADTMPVGWEGVRSGEWTTGELNAELSVNALRNFFGNGKSGQAQKPEWSRVLQMKRCKHLYDPQTQKFNFDIQQEPHLLQPITDIKVVIRSADGQEDGTECKTERDLIAAGYFMVKFVDSATAAPKPTKTSVSAVLKKANGLFTWWDGVAFATTYSHADPSDLNYMMMERRPPLFIYARRGVVPVPLRDITILPFLKETVTDPKKIQFMQEIKKDFTTAYNAFQKITGTAKPAIDSSYQFPITDMTTPPGKGCSFMGERVLQDVQFDDKEGVKHSIVRYIVHRKWAGRTIDQTSLEFILNCDYTNTNERWSRVAVSPYEGSWDDGVYRMLYLWTKKAFAPVALPDTTKPELECPSLCELSKQTAFVKPKL